MEAIILASMIDAVWQLLINKKSLVVKSALLSRAVLLRNQFTACLALTRGDLSQRSQAPPRYLSSC